MTLADWIKTILTVIGGGLAGALLTTFVTTYRAQLQPVGERIETAPLFAPSATGTALRTTVTVRTARKVTSTTISTWQMSWS